jgi:hypothetical protein
MDRIDDITSEEYNDLRLYMRLHKENLDNMRRLGSEFGFTPASKSRVAVPVKSLQENGNDIQSKLEKMLNITDVKPLKNGKAVKKK